MIEWTICNKCSKLLDNDKETCPFCGSEVSKISIQFLKNRIYSLSIVINTIDSIDALDMFPLISELKSKNITLYSVLINDLFNWFSYLGLDDVSDRELEFINSLLDVNYTKEEISDLINTDIEEVPLSFKCFREIDSSGWMGNNCRELFDNFSLFGKLFLTVDGELDDEAFDKYTSYINNLKNKLGDNILSTTPPRDIPVRLNDVATDEPKKDEKTIEDCLDELNKLIGLEKVKKDVNSLINLVQIRKLREERGLKQPPMSLHLVFSGNPGTGKTTVARLLSEIYAKIGILSKGHLVECDRSALVGGYVGQTAIKTQGVIESALGGILFIDEAYSLAKNSENDYGLEAIDTILKAMEDKRDDFIVIVAGYPQLMDNFLHSNPGLESRFNKFIYFEDYNDEELYDIFLLMCEDMNLKLDDGADLYLKEYFKKLCENRPPNFANGRAVRNLFEDVITAQANRLAPQKDITDEELNTLIYEDFLIE